MPGNFIELTCILLIIMISCGCDHVTKPKLTSTLLNNSKNNILNPVGPSSNSTSDYFLIINVLKDLKLLQYYMNKTKNPGNYLTNPRAITNTNDKQDRKIPGTYVTKLTVFYSNKDQLTCNAISSNTSLYQCLDHLLDAKLKKS